LARRAKPGKAAAKAVALVPSCPYCAMQLEPPPTSSRSCPRCRHRIVVKRIEGRVIYLTEAAVAFFEAERRRIAGAARFTRERARWLKLAAAAGAPPERAARLVAAQLSEETVDAARALYMTTVERAFRSAKRERRWDDASRIRREQAMALFRVPGSGSIPSEALVTLHREGVAAELRGLAEIAKEAELVSAACCDACRADDGRIVRIAQELLAPRLPHAGCIKSLCRCRWDMTARDRTNLRRYQRRPARANPRANERAVPAAPQPAV
jgi:DNA-directed RNA polymerase subunit RPC12/RpoP